jgi:diketogulonate reductase-like aldo/keto reductase
MEQRPFGWTGVAVPVIGQGTWQMEDDDRAQALAALVSGLEAGLTHIDTAELYGGGSVEELVGEAIAGRRDQVFLASKVLPANASRQGTVAACERSLRRLGTDRLDLYLLHWPGPHPLADTMAAFEQLREAGKIRFYGVSNFDERELAEAASAAVPGRLACNQVLYHLGERAIEHAVVPACERLEAAVVAYSPFGSGRFPGPRTAGGRLLAEIARAHQATAHQIALAFLTRRRASFAIPKAATPEHALENAAASSITLTADELARIDAAFPRGPRQTQLPTL